MDRLAFTSLKAVTEERIRREMLTNELTNVTTTGFKRSYDSATRSIKVEGPGFDSRLMPVIQARDVIDLTPGTLMVTGRKLDISMDAKTVLGVSAKGGDLAFTRRGDLRVNPTGVIETGTGLAVRGEDGREINAPAGFEVEITADGTVWARDPNTPDQASQRVGRLLLRDASDTPLVRREDGLYRPTGRSVTAGGDFRSGPQPVSVTAGALEGSNVSPIEAMVRMLDQSRSFETQIKIIKESRGLDESGATMLRSGR